MRPCNCVAHKGACCNVWIHGYHAHTCGLLNRHDPPCKCALCPREMPADAEILTLADLEQMPRWKLPSAPAKISATPIMEPKPLVTIISNPHERRPVRPRMEINPTTRATTGDLLQRVLQHIEENPGISNYKLCRAFAPERLYGSTTLLVAMQRIRAVNGCYWPTTVQAKRSNSPRCATCGMPRSHGRKGRPPKTCPYSATQDEQVSA